MKKTLVSLGILMALVIGSQTTFAACMHRGCPLVDPCPCNAGKIILPAASPCGFACPIANPCPCPAAPCCNQCPAPCPCPVVAPCPCPAAPCPCPAAPCPSSSDCCD